MTSKTSGFGVSIAENELLALHKALLEAKFHAHPDNADIAGSPFVAAIADRVFDALVQWEESRGNLAKADEWKEWRRAETKAWIMRRVQEYAVENPHWMKWDAAERRDYLRCALSPFQLPDRQLDEMMVEIDTAISSGRTGSGCGG